MIYLIGGPPKCGKTTLAKTLSRKTHIPWISADTLQNIASAYLPAEDAQKNFPHKYLKGKNNDETYAKNTTEEMVSGYVKQAKTSYRAISMLVETVLIDKDDFIIEGYQVTPEIVKEITDKFGSNDIKVIFLVKHDEDQFVENINKSTTPNDWIIRKTKQPETYKKIAAMISLYSQYFEKQAESRDFKLINMDHEFENKIVEALEYLKTKI